MHNSVSSGKHFLCDRSEIIAKYIILNNATVRSAAQYFGLSKSTIHKDITTKLEKINPPLFAAVREVLEKNKSERHLRGGQATKLHYINLKNIPKNNGEKCIFFTKKSK